VTGRAKVSPLAGLSFFYHGFNFDEDQHEFEDHMTRFSAIAVALIATTPALAQDQQDLCENTAVIVGDAVTARADGASAQEAASMVGDAMDADSAFKGAVQPIVDWVYTLPQDQLTDEVAVAYQEQCLAQ